MSEIELKKQEMKEYISRMEYVQSLLGLVHWDMRVNMPPKAVNFRGEVSGYLAGELYKMTTSEKVKEFIDYFLPIDDLDDITKATVRKIKKEYDKTVKIPEKMYTDFVNLISVAESVWEEAKAKNDYGLFKPYLKQIIDYNKQFADIYGYKNKRYDALLDDYEMGMTEEELDRIFNPLKEVLINLIKKLNERGDKPKDHILKGKYPVEAQNQFAKIIAKKLGYDLESGRIDTSAHPFTIELGPSDIRITTRYDEENFISGLLSNIHEMGHAIYEQNISRDLRGTMLMTGASMGIHESQSRFYENIIGRSREFWKHVYPDISTLFPSLKKLSVDEIYQAVNSIKPSLIRVDADEITYSLHIIIRYEMEKMMIDEDVDVDELPSIWNKKYKDYLGVEPSNNSEGILQDVHWSGGSIGYFPSYALGNIYGAQILNTMLKQMPDFYERIENGDFLSIKNWLSDNIHKHGSIYTPSELIEKVSGEKLNPEYFIKRCEKIVEEKLK
ncbi:putative metalloprotease YpwA [Caloramator mitchellensis]|uniref:Metal-dependent carboxypeptidase n=1 Tax=Caloramator mitchellensis TaxID=908809 RepID=A0A0R3JVQ5_CALMK|nr:carboxypeptidase M32 [Caloramator mitchellensis]KRQ87608.1 putative metalloprotease YpwA [Caloramator mitchellensis]